MDYTISEMYSREIKCGLRSVGNVAIMSQLIEFQTLKLISGEVICYKYTFA